MIDPTSGIDFYKSLADLNYQVLIDYCINMGDDENSLRLQKIEQFVKLSLPNMANSMFGKRD